MAVKNLLQAINEALDQKMADDKRVVVFGEDSGYEGGVFRVTAGLQKKYGEDRCFDTPIAEAAIAGSAIGMAIMILIALPFIRAIMVYTLPAIYFILRKPFILPGKELKICWYSGMVRGVIAFALCLQIPDGDFIVLVTLVIVMVTTVVGATMLKSFAKFIGVKEENDNEEN